MTTLMQQQYEKLEDLKGQLRYTREALNSGAIELWEAKEYSTLEASLLITITELEGRLGA